MISAVDPAVSAAVTQGFSDTSSLLVTVLIPALLALVVLSLAVRIGIKYLKRGASG